MRGLVIVLTLLQLTIYNCGFNKYIIKPIRKASWEVVSYKPVQIQGSTLLFLWSQYCEATADAVNFGGHYGASKDLWHLYKNQSKFALILSMGLKGMAIGQNHSTVSDVGRRLFYECLTAWVIWHWRYRYVKYGTAFETSAYANQHAIYIPNPWTDAYIGLEGAGVLSFDFLRLASGLYGLIKY